MKRILRFIVVAVLASMLVTVGVSSAEPATITFDTDKLLEHLVLEGSIEKGDLTFEITDEKYYIGKSLKVTANLKEAPGSENIGFTIDTNIIGIENLAGYTVEASALFPSELKSNLAFAQMYVHGNVWLDATYEPSKKNEWQTVKIKVRDDVENNIIGFKLPFQKEYSGTVCYIDQIMIYDPDGKIYASFDASDDINYAAETANTTTVLTEAQTQDLVRKTTKSPDDILPLTSQKPFLIAIAGGILIVIGIIVAVVVSKSKRKYY